MCKRYVWLFLLPALLAFGSCQKCEDIGERKFGILFFANDTLVSPDFTEVYGIGGNGLITLSAPDSLYRFPISLHQDSSTFVLKENNAEPDTLTLTYKRDFFYQNRNCGIRVKFSNFGVGRSTTYEQVTVTGTLPTPGIFANYPEEVYEVRIYR